MTQFLFGRVRTAALLRAARQLGAAGTLADGRASGYLALIAGDFALARQLLSGREDARSLGYLGEAAWGQGDAFGALQAYCRASLVGEIDQAHARCQPVIELLDLGDELELDDPFAWLAVLADLAGKHSPRSSMVGKTQAPRRSWKMRASMRALIAARPFNAVVPVGYTQGTPTPLVVLLHGYTATGATQDAYFHLSELAQQRTFLLALPDGIGPRGRQFWNATDACCAFGQTVDDVAYLTALIDDMKARYSVDPKRIFLVGHSNGGFMSHRMACDRSELIAGIVSLAGAVWADSARCTPTSPVNVLQVHGTLDAVIRYTGAMLTSIGGYLDLVTDLAFAETERESFTGCPGGAAVSCGAFGGAVTSPRSMGNGPARSTRG